MTKICIRCNVEKKVEEFCKNKKSKDNYNYYCKDCIKEKTIINIESIKKSIKKYCLRNKEKKRQYDKIYSQKNKDKISEIKKIYCAKNKQKVNLQRKQRRNNDIQYKIKENLRNRFRDALKGNYKSGSAVRDLGCSGEQLKQWIGQQFEAGWTWENYGKMWNIDHIIPLSKFDLTDKNQIIKACHWFNLRPLDAKENIIRGNRI